MSISEKCASLLKTNDPILLQYCLNGSISHTSKFVTTFTFAVPVGFLIIALYLLLRKYFFKFRHFYEPRKYPSFNNISFKHTQKQYFLSLLPSFFNINHHDNINSTNNSAEQYMHMFNSFGLDGVIFLLFIQSCIKICLTCIIIALIFLIPVYATEPKVILLFWSNPNDFDSGSLKLEMSMDWMQMFAITHITPGSWRLWSSVICAYAFMLTTLKIFYDDCFSVSQIVDAFLAERCTSHYTVMISNIPAQYRNRSNLSNLLTNVYPGTIKDIIIVKNCEQLILQYKNLNENRLKFDAAIKYLQVHNQRLQVIQQCIPYVKRFDAIEFYSLKINQCEKNIERISEHPQFTPVKLYFI